MNALGNITFYADDPPALARFWSAVFGYPPQTWEEPLRSELLAAGLTDDDLARRGLAEDPTGAGPRLFFHHADRRKAGRNRLHLDITVTAADGDDRPRAQLLAEEKDRLVGLGASVVRLVDQRWGPWPEHYWQLRDPEGNEFCLQ
ncbi:VOC family protein [Microbacterium sp. W1N]|uniref:VOC family protein n=1 Tax=Microbacterium festucae TaxID=2977531 RepID=UPI0021BF5D13|nr:VOC family protein [Microbacterium festucae]MCT9821438.1 VOC family protein [Microbacterium festucae]